MASQTVTKTLDSFPIQLGIRLLLDSVSYSNPLPDWIDVLSIRFTARQNTIRSRIQKYMAQTPPDPPFQISLPRRSGAVKTWSMPSVNDQIVLQTCVTSIAKTLFQKTVNRDRVFSYRYTRDPSAVALTEDHLGGWRAFQNETRRRCNSDDCVLQFDLEEAFHSIDRARFIQFVRKAIPNDAVVDLLKILLDSFAMGEPGLPLVNDSVFFLGNAYLSVVDNVVSRYSSSFVRFVDDYRIFGNSLTELERVIRGISSELADLGFRINAHKLRLSSAEEYLESLAKVRYAQKSTDGAVTGDAEDPVGEDPEHYPGSAVVFTGIIPPNIMMAQIQDLLERPQEKLNEGQGRFLMGSLRRARLDAQVVDGQYSNDRPALRKHFVGQLSQNRSVLKRVNELLREYTNAPQEIWRLTWLLYLLHDIDFDIADSTMSAALHDSLSRIHSSNSVPPIARLWTLNVLAANKLGSKRLVLTPDRIEALHDRGYIESGRLLLETN